MIVSIIRHGTTVWNTLKKIQGQADPPLNEEGIALATELGKRLKDEIHSYKAIFSSERKRAKMTAELIRGTSKKSIFYDNLLNSRNVGTFSGMTLKEIEEQYPEDYRKWLRWDPNFKPPGGESTRDLTERCKKFIQFLKNTFPPDSKIFVVTHRENVAILARLISGEKIPDALRTVKNCTIYKYRLTN